MNAAAFVPELGQAAFGAPWQEYAMPGFVRTGLAELGAMVAAESSTGEDPTNNTGASFENGVFRLVAYCWCDGSAPAHAEGCPPNFEHKATRFAASWYKYLGRGSSVSSPISRADFERLILECQASLADGGVRAERESLASAMTAVLPAGSFADTAIEGDELSMRVWLPWPEGIDPAADEDAPARVAGRVAEAMAAVTKTMSAAGWNLLTGDGTFHLTAPFPPVGDGSVEDAASARHYRELNDAELTAAGYVDPGEAIWIDRLELVAHSGINIFRVARRGAEVA